MCVCVCVCSHAHNNDPVIHTVSGTSRCLWRLITKQSNGPVQICRVSGRIAVSAPEDSKQAVRAHNCLTSGTHGAQKQEPAKHTSVPVKLRWVQLLVNL